MPRQLKYQVHESPEELQVLMHQQSAARSKERLQALYLYRSGLGSTVPELALLLGRSVPTIRRWLSIYRSHGLSGLLAPPIRTGRPRVLSPDILEKLREYLAHPDVHRSYKQIQSQLQTEYGVEIPYKTLCRIINSELRK